jgi:membrane-associated protein
MEYLLAFINILLHLDQHLTQMVADYGTWIYVILFLIIFSETGLVVAPFLPGDSLLFVAGAVAAIGGMDLGVLMGVLLAAAMLGNIVNYSIGRFVGERVYQWPDRWFFKKASIDKTGEFFVRHGGKTLVISRFLPLFRTFAPFVAGVGQMAWPRFLLFNAIGAAAWVVSLTVAGYFFGNLPIIKNNLTVVILAIIGFSLLPVMWGWWQHRKSAS